MVIKKFLHIQEALGDEIANGVYAVGDKLPSERELAKSFGASHMTVNKAISGLEASGLVKRIQGDGTYVTERKRAIMKTIGYIGPTEISMEHVVLPGALFRAIRMHDCISSVFDLSILHKSLESLEMFLLEGPKAVIVDARSGFEYSMLRALRKTTKLLFIDNYYLPKAIADASYVLGDYFDGGVQAAKALMRQGRRNISIVTHSSRCAVKAGAEYALKEAGLEPASVIYSSEATDKVWKEYVACKKNDGLISSNDFRITQAIDYMKGQGVRIPDDIAIISYYDTPWAQAYNLTSVNPDRKTMADMAMAHIMSPGIDTINIKVKPKIIFRGSCQSGIEQCDGESAPSS